MVKRGRRKSTTLMVRPLFEPSRLGPSCLAEAYERVVPIKRRARRAARVSDDAMDTDRGRHVGGIRG